MRKEQQIDWGSPEPHLFINPSVPRFIADRATLKQLPDLPKHIWLASSGSTDSSNLNLYALCKEAFLVSANAVNQHLQATQKDIWLNVLPHFHVGGLGVYARAHVSGCKVIDQSAEKWSAHHFISWVKETQATLCSLVPTQIFDLVELGEPAPKSLRAIVVGGAKLDDHLLQQALKLGYPLLPSFGMTEVCSQIATAVIGSTDRTKLKVLSHVEVKLTDDQILAIKSKSLFTAKALCRPNGAIEVLWRATDWFVTQDRAQLAYGYLQPLGRMNEQLKISGELIDLLDLRNKFSEISCTPNFYLFVQPDERRGGEVAVVVESSLYQNANKWIAEFNQSVLPVAKIKALYILPQIPRSALGKVEIDKLKSALKI